MGRQQLDSGIVVLLFLGSLGTLGGTNSVSQGDRHRIRSFRDPTNIVYADARDFILGFRNAREPLIPSVCILTIDQECKHYQWV